MRTDELGEWPPFKALGPEPFDLDARELKRRLAGRKAPIKLLLLDQRIIAGLGNIYVCEALYRAGIHPTRPGGSISLDRLKRLVPAIHEVLAEAIAAGGRRFGISPPRWRARLFLQELCSLRPGRAAVRLRRDGEADRAGRPFDLLLSPLPALTC